MQPLRLVVMGGLNMDLIVRMPRLPRPGETLTGEDLLRAPGGKGGNQAVAAARLGASVWMSGRVGHDPFGRELSRTLRNGGVSTRWVLECERTTGSALIIVDEHGENIIAVAQGANAELLPDNLPRRAIERADALVASLEVPVSAVEAGFHIARSAGCRTVLNAAPAQVVPEALLDQSDVVICNEVELGTLLGGEVSPSNELNAARELRRAPDQVVVVTLGERGALGVAGGSAFEQPTFPVRAIDAVGAGDAFVAGFVVGRWWSAGIQAALRLGCAAGALATTVHGAQPSMPTFDAVNALLRASQ